MFISAAYIFLFLAIEWSSSFLYVALILCTLPVFCKIIQRYSMIERSYTSWEILVLLCAIIGMFFLFRSESNFVSKSEYIKINDNDFTYNNFSAYIYGFLCVVCWAIATTLLQKNKAYVHHSIDTWYVGFFTAMVVPAFILGYFSIHPTKLTYEWIQFAYFGVTGFFWWLFHSFSSQVLEQDTKLSTLPSIYVFLIMTIIGDGIVRSKDLEWNQIIAFALIVAPTFALMVMRFLNIIRE